MIYRVIEDGFETDDIDSVIDHCVSRDYYDEDDDYYENWVNDNYEGVSIEGTYYSAYEILENFGDLCLVLDEYKDSMTSSAKEEADWDLRHADPGDKIDVQGCTVEVLCDDDLDTGDYDGDEELTHNEDYVANGDLIEELRMKIEAKKEIDRTEQENNKAQQNNYYDLFQTIGV